jgi:antitoxin ParD1/3/4
LDWEGGVVDAAVFEEVLFGFLDFDDEAFAADSLTVDVEDGFPVNRGAAELFGVAEGEVGDLVVGGEEGVEEVDQEVFVGFRAEDALEAEVGQEADVSVLEGIDHGLGLGRGVLISIIEGDCALWGAMTSGRSLTIAPCLFQYSVGVGGDRSLESVGYTWGKARGTPMTQVTISLPESAKAFIDEQIASGQYGSADLMMADLIAQAQERQAKIKVNGLLKGVLEKNETVEATDEWWDKRRF